MTTGAERPTRARAILAGATAACSLAVAGSARRQFARSGTTINPVDPTRASVLVTTGVNARTRNPMYIGLTGLLAANAVRRGSVRAVLPVAAFLLLMDRMQIPAEEAALAEKFGAGYETYRATVPRWLDRRSLGSA